MGGVDYPYSKILQVSVWSLNPDDLSVDDPGQLLFGVRQRFLTPVTTEDPVHEPSRVRMYATKSTEVSSRITTNLSVSTKPFTDREEGRVSGVGRPRQNDKSTTSRWTRVYKTVTTGFLVTHV